MSVQTAKAILKDFLSDGESNVLALTGAWGTGKTYAWREALLQHKNNVKFKRYCYVSLFGINSMAELRMSLFTKSVDIQTLGKKLDFETVNEHWGALTKDWLKGQMERFAPLMRTLPHGSTVSLGIEALALNSVRDTLVCLDDFERQVAIKAQDVLGLINELSEEKGCKVALIFNAEKLSQRDEYRAYREKAIDFEVLYAPTVEEAFDLAFDGGFPNREFILRRVLDLGITNVRILRKLQQLLTRIIRSIEGLHASVIEASVATTVLLCWCAYGSDEVKPRIEEIDHWNKELISLKRDGERDPATIAWIRKLKAYGFVRVDDLDLALARIVESGYVEGSGFVEIAKMQDGELRGEERSARFSAVWRRFYDSFSDDQDGFIAELHESTLQGLVNIGLNDFNSTVRLLRELQRDDLADDLINRFVEANHGKPSAFNLKAHPFGGSIDDPKLRATFLQVHAELTQLPTLEESVVFIVQNGGFNEEHLEAMKKASVDDYHAMFLKLHADPKLPDLIRCTLRWGEGDHREIATKAREALERIKGTSLLNAVRVSRYGI